MIALSTTSLNHRITRIETKVLLYIYIYISVLKRSFRVHLQEDPLLYISASHDFPNTLFTVVQPINNTLDHSTRILFEIHSNLVRNHQDSSVLTRRDASMELVSSEKRASVKTTTIVETLL